MRACASCGGRGQENAILREQIGRLQRELALLRNEPSGPRESSLAVTAYVLRRVVPATPAERVAAGTAAELSPREIEVAALVADGRSNAEIAYRLHISQHTAARHVQNILTKLDLRSRAHLARWAAEHGAVYRA